MSDFVFYMLKSYSILIGYCNGARGGNQIPPTGHAPSALALAESHQKSWNFMPFSKALSFQNWPKATTKHKKSDTEIIRIPTSVKSWFLQYISYQMLDFKASDIQIQDPEIIKTRDMETSTKQIHMLLQSWLKTLKMQSRSPLKLERHPSLEPKVSLLVFPSAPGSLDGPPGVPKLTTSTPQFTVNCKTRHIGTTSGHQRTSTNFSKNLDTSTKNNKPK